MIVTKTYNKPDNLINYGLVEKIAINAFKPSVKNLTEGVGWLEIAVLGKLLIEVPKNKFHHLEDYTSYARESIESYTIDWIRSKSGRQ
jgi:hypothetical protein